VNTTNKQIIATTIVTMDLGSVNAKSVIKTYPTQTSKVALITSSSGKHSIQFILNSV